MKTTPTRRQVRDALRQFEAFAPDAGKARAASETLGLDKPERTRAARRDLEGAEQRALFQWAAKSINTFPELKYLFHVPNGGARNAITGARLKAQGVKPGVPDVYLDVSRGGYHGLRIELKAGKGKASDDQEDWILNLQKEGYYAFVCVGWENARRIIIKYLSL